MPCPEKFRDSLEQFEISQEVIKKINEGYEEIVSKTPKKIKAAYFKRAMDIMDEYVDEDKKKELLEWNACCKGGARQKASKAFAKENLGLSIEEKLAKIVEVPYMGKPIMNGDGTITVHAVSYKEDNLYRCACSNFNHLKRQEPVSKTYCYCCGGHFKYHYEIMLGVKLAIKEVLSSPLDMVGQKPCVFIFEIIQ